MLIRNIARRPLPSALKGQHYGLEFEFEDVPDVATATSDVAHLTSGCFSVVEDGSLRGGGAEFITVPITLADMQEPVRELYAIKEESGWTGGPRCGTHVHMDMSSRTTEQVRSICAAYACVEPAIFEWCGIEREENIYCIPWYRANDNSDLVRALQEPNGIRARIILDGLVKYSALNAAPLARFGTLEFRGAPAFDTADDVLRFVAALDRLIHTADQYRPEEIVDMFETNAQAALSRFWPGFDRVAPLLEEVNSIGRAAKFVCTNEADWTLPPQPPARAEEERRLPRLRGMERRGVRLFHSEANWDFNEILSEFTQEVS